MFETSSTYGLISSGFASSDNYSFSSSTSLGDAFRSSVGTSIAPISYRTSDAHIHSTSSVIITTPTTFGTGSFIKIHRKNVSTQQNFQSISYGISFPTDGDDYIPPTGELDPDFASPIGDVLLPMLLMAFVYATIRFFKNRKLQKSINN